MHLTEERKAFLSALTARLKDADLTTDRLLLRPFEERDFQDYWALHHDREMSRLSGDKYLDTEEEARAAFNELLRQYAYLHRTFAVVLKGTDQAVGHFDLGYYPFLEEEETLRSLSGVSLSFSLEKSHQKYGYMSEMLRAVLQWLFEEEKLDFVNCGYFDFNLGSKRLQEKLGFRFWRTHTFQADDGEKIGDRKPDVPQRLSR